MNEYPLQHYPVRIVYLTRANLALRRAHTRNITKTVEALNTLPDASCIILQEKLWRKLFLERNNFDILYLRDHRLFLLAAAVRFFLRKKVVHEMHSTHGLSFLRRLSFLVSHGAVFLTKKLEDYYNKGKRKPSIVVHGNGVDLPAYAGVSGKTPGAYRIVYTGSMRWYALDILIAMMVHMPADARLLLIGLKNEQIRTLRHQAEKLGVSGRVDLRCRVSVEEIPPLLFSADVLVNPLSANLPGSISVKLYEYFAAGKPIVSTLGGANDEILRDGENCLIADLTPESFSEKIARLRSNPVLADRIARGAKEDAKRYTWEERARRIADFITALNKRMGLCRAGLLLLGYHSVDGTNSYLSVSWEMFERQLLYLKRNRYTFLQFQDLFEIQRGKQPMPKKSVMIYFDDGFRDNLLHVYPLLKKYNVPAALFLVVEYIEKGPPLYLSWDDVRAMRDVFEFGTHTMTHRKLTALSADDVRYEIERSRAIIEEKIEGRVIALSYPKSRWNQEVRTIAEELGFDFMLAHGHGYNNGPDYRFLKKISVDADDTMMMFTLKLSLPYPIVRGIKALRNKLKRVIVGV